MKIPLLAATVAMFIALSGVEAKREKLDKMLSMERYEKLMAKNLPWTPVHPSKHPFRHMKSDDEIKSKLGLIHPAHMPDSSPIKALYH